MERIELLVAVCLYLLIALGYPTLRIWIKHGVWPVVFTREAMPAARIVGALFGLFLASLVVWAALYWVKGPEAIGVIQTPAWLQAFGWTSMLAGTVITIWAQKHMGLSWRVGIDERPTTLIQHGLFRLSRNPIFSGMILTLAGLVCLTPSAWSIAGAVLGIAMIRIQVRFEEQHLIALHNEAYLNYARQVGRFLPGLGKIRSRAPRRAD